ncbi:ATP-binding protein [Rhodobacter ferrooxidans]|uniref:ATPase associated with various cellular activities AAA_5 n=1 Tax=Rhodobacter ferrooxidans TaxID=371731 RepID=C8S5A1_9RHOB|nr:MoxR family ATPase [Rhodobacter sp. SW2]EEW23834.1 ATPase associated with various cellular activities AAA_5 [Rhodobacter sp. SW2]
MSVNATTVSAGEALRVLQAGWAAQMAGGLTVSWMLHGRPGVGKTELVQSLASQIGAELFDLRLTTIEPQDLRGLPYFDHEAKKTVWYRPEDLPDTAAPAILFLDELTAAAPALQPTVYGLLQERRVGRHRLPANVMIVAAGNRVEDGAIAYDMGTALSDRLIHMIVQANAEDWVKHYAMPAGIHPIVAAFIRTRPDLLETTEDSLRRGQMIACTPRSWTRVSRIMDSVSDRALRGVMIAGTVGSAAAAEFALLADEIAATVQIEAMLATPRRERAALYPRTLHGLTALVYGLTGAASRENLAVAIEILADLRGMGGPALGGLPVSELASFGFELLIGRAFEQGWQEVFAGSEAYAGYAAERRAAGLP